MALILLAILYTALFAITFQTVRNAGQAGPAGRTAGLPLRQRRTLVSLMLVLFCTVVNIYWMADPGGPARPALAGLTLFDLFGLVCALLAGAALRRPPSARVVRQAGLALAGLCLSVTVVWGSLSLYGLRPEVAAFLARTADAWGVTPASMGALALVHYLLTALLVSAALAAHDEYERLPAWDRDRAFRWVSLFAVLMATGYVLFTWRVVASG